MHGNLMRVLAICSLMVGSPVLAQVHGASPVGATSVTQWAEGQRNNDRREQEERERQARIERERQERERQARIERERRERLERERAECERHGEWRGGRCEIRSRHG
ncbi:hypothetical protein LY474_07675 [Myxococcus stipitatus]|uniref:hypothetical protein n=1 Tax=Myxococcus stipitatus TaxID=83455 RepID=UPI001F15F858|nr:hypothetical protein [Myxococcus stipitatus]MCE9667691.1 hypothetical protein [Myxococcus stipitatus]